MADLLSYRGDAGLGLGSNPNIPAPDNVDLNQIGQAARDIMLQDNQWNVLKYQQKIKDRDQFRDLVDSGQVAMGEILPEYQPVFDSAKKKVEEFYSKNGDQLLSDPNKYREYQGLVRTLKDVATHAQVNTKTVKELQAEKAKQTLPTKQAEVQKFIDGQMASTTKDFWKQISPYQQVYSFKMAPVLTVPATRKGVRQDPNDPLKSYNSSVLDYDDIVKFKYNQYLNDNTGEEAEDFRQFYNKTQNLPVLELGQMLNSMDAQIDKYNKDRGFKKGQQGFVDPVKREAVGGRLVLKESIPDFTAKYALTNQPQYVNETPVTDYKLGALQTAQKRADTDATYKRILAANGTSRLRAYQENVKSQIKARNKPEEQAQFMDEMYNRNLLNQTSLIAPSKEKGKVNFNVIKADESLPVFTMDGGKVVPLQPIDAKPILKNNKIIGYSGGHYEPQYLLGGRKVQPQAIADLYKQYKQAGGTEPSFDAFLKTAIESNRIDFLIKGANGTVDRKLSLATQRALSNQNTSKGETGIFDSELPPDEPVSSQP